MKNEWGGGFTANVTVAQSDGAMSATNLSDNATITPGDNVRLGFQGAWASNDASPTGLTLDGNACG